MLGKEVFIEAYGKVTVPKPMDTRGSADPEFILQRDSFFMRLQMALDLSHLVLSETVTVKADVMSSDYHRGTLILFEDLWFQDMQVMGTAIQRLGPGASRNARFSKYPLNPDTAELIQDYRIIEGTAF